MKRFGMIFVFMMAIIGTTNAGVLGICNDDTNDMKNIDDIFCDNLDLKEISKGKNSLTDKNADKCKVSCWGTAGGWWATITSCKNGMVVSETENACVENKKAAAAKKAKKTASADTDSKTSGSSGAGSQQPGASASTGSTNQNTASNTCYKSYDLGSSLINNSGEYPTPNFTILFDTNKSEIQNKECLNALKKDIADINAENCKHIIIISMADNAGSTQTNNALSDARGAYVQELFSDTKFSGKVSYIPAGKVTATLYDKTFRNQDYRAALVYLGCGVNQNLIEINITNNYGTEPGKPDPNKNLRDKITKIGNDISGITSKFKISAWKNANGDFNTSRLVSDSVAGVVLGTAGGLITSSIIKKNQVKGGFEDISCTIGGQNVAGWNDEFRVGIK